MRTVIGATAVNIAKPTNLNAPMIHAFLDNIRYISIELNGLILFDTRDDVPCDMDKWRETRARFPVGFSPRFGRGGKRYAAPSSWLRDMSCCVRRRAGR